jgi:hypothetical protein
MTQTQSLSAMPAIPWIYYRYISHDLDQRFFGFFFFAFSFVLLFGTAFASFYLIDI